MDQTRASSDELLRRALEFAVAVAQAGQRVRPPLVTPPALRPFLKFQKLPGSALATVRQAVDDDADFRTRLASVVTEELVGPAGMAWLCRPEGWEAEFDRIVHDDAAETERKEADRQERSAAKRLDVAEQSAARSRAELAVAADEIRVERDKRQRAESRVTELTDRVRRLEADLDATRRGAERMAGQLAAATAALDDAATAARAEADEREAWGRERAALLERLDAALEARVAAEARRPVAGPTAPVADVVGPAAAALREASMALGKLAGALGDTASALSATDRFAGRPAEPSTPQSFASAAGAGRRTRPSRQPLSIPGGIYLDAPEAAAHLLRAPDVLLIVDGYNAAKTGWPEADLAAQRERLLDVLEDQVRRAGTRIHVVFDGAAVIGAHGIRRLLHVSFSPPGVTADDVIRELVADLPSEQAVVVATSDQAVVASVRAMGANTIASAQLLAAVSR